MGLWAGYGMGLDGLGSSVGMAAASSRTHYAAPDLHRTGGFCKSEAPGRDRPDGVRWAWQRLWSLPFSVLSGAIGIQSSNTRATSPTGGTGKTHRTNLHLSSPSETHQGDKDEDIGNPGNHTFRNHRENNDDAPPPPSEPPRGDKDEDIGHPRNHTHRSTRAAHDDALSPYIPTRNPAGRQG